MTPRIVQIEYKTPRRTISRKTHKNPAKRKNTRNRGTTKADVYRWWGLPEVIIRRGGLKSLIRYVNPPEKGCYWWHFSRKVRERDVSKFGTCISCGREITVETSQCGHFIPAASCGPELLFDERNNNAECERCNAFDEFHLIGYAKNLDLRYGAGTAQSLIERYEKIKEQRKNGLITKDFTKKQYEQMLTDLTGLHTNLA